jgi:hypothetical protein
MKILPVASKLFHADRRTHRQTGRSWWSLLEITRTSLKRVNLYVAIATRHTHTHAHARTHTHTHTHTHSTAQHKMPDVGCLSFIVQCLCKADRGIFSSYMRGFSTSRNAAVKLLPPVCGYSLLQSTVKRFLVMAVLRHSLWASRRHVNVSLLSNDSSLSLPLLWSPLAQVHVSWATTEENVLVPIPEVTRLKYLSLPVLQQTATCAVIGSHIT